MADVEENIPGKILDHVKDDIDILLLTEGEGDSFEIEAVNYGVFDTQAFEVGEGADKTTFIIYGEVVEPVQGKFDFAGGVTSAAGSKGMLLMSRKDQKFERVLEGWGKGAFNQETKIASFPNGKKIDLSELDIEGEEGTVKVTIPLLLIQSAGGYRKKSQSNRKKKSQSNRKKKSQSNRKKKSKKGKYKKRKSY